MSPLVRPAHFRYTLRALVVVITIFCLWAGFEANRAYKERVAAQVLVRRGAGLAYWNVLDGELLGKYFGGNVRAIPSPYRIVLSELFGGRLVAGVSLHGEVDEEVVSAILRLAAMRSLSVELSSKWEGMSKAELELRRHTVPAGRLTRVLAKQRSLKIFEVHGVLLAEEDWRAIGGANGLASIHLEETNPSETALRDILLLPHLETLRLETCHVTGSELSSAMPSDSLKELQCIDCPLGDAFIETLSKNPPRHIWLRDAKFTDQSIPLIEAMPSIESLSRGRLSEEGLHRLRQNRPDLHL